jgi:hypothetical protein
MLLSEVSSIHGKSLEQNRDLTWPAGSFRSDVWHGWMYMNASLLLFFLFLCFWYCTNVLYLFVYSTMLSLPFQQPVVTVSPPPISVSISMSLLIPVYLCILLNGPLSKLHFTFMGWVTSPSPSTGTMFSFILQLWPALLKALLLPSAGIALRIIGILKSHCHIKERYWLLFN